MAKSVVTTLRLRNASRFLSMVSSSTMASPAEPVLLSLRNLSSSLLISALSAVSENLLFNGTVWPEGSSSMSSSPRLVKPSIRLNQLRRKVPALVVSAVVDHVRVNPLAALQAVPSAFRPDSRERSMLLAVSGTIRSIETFTVVFVEPGCRSRSMIPISSSLLLRINASCTSE